MRIIKSIRGEKVSRIHEYLSECILLNENARSIELVFIKNKYGRLGLRLREVNGEIYIKKGGKIKWRKNFLKFLEEGF